MTNKAIEQRDACETSLQVTATKLEEVEQLFSELVAIIAPLGTTPYKVTKRLYIDGIGFELDTHVEPNVHTVKKIELPEPHDDDMIEAFLDFKDIEEAKEDDEFDINGLL